MAAISKRTLYQVVEQRRVAVVGSVGQGDVDQATCLLESFLNPPTPISINGCPSK